MKSLIAIFLAVTFSLCVDAAAPQVGANSSSGYYRFMVGDIEVTTISDGRVELDVSKLLQNVDEDEINRILKKNFLTKDFNMEVDSFLINTGQELILVDTGVGKGVMPSTGYLLKNIKASGYLPEQVDAVILTHMHGDHIGGLVSGDEAAFPNATLYVNEKELDYWLDKKNMENEHDMNNRRIFIYAPHVIEPYKKSGKLKVFSPDKEIIPGIHAIASYGHTVGHTSFLVESNNHKLLILGDVINLGPVQFENPKARMSGFDSNPDQAEKTRIRIFENVASNGTLIASSHLAFPSVGYLRKQENVYEFIPFRNN